MVKNQKEESQESSEAQQEKKSAILEKMRANPWIVSTAVLGLATIILLVLSFAPGITGGAISESSASTKLVDFLNGKVGGGVTFISSESLGSIYQVTVSYQNQEIPVYISRDGKYFIQGATPLSTEAEQTNTNSQTPSEIVKSDKPLVELFVMTHCPYGTQAEKGILPVYNLLGSAIDSKIRFVHYFMHGAKEENETYNQLCIREEQSSKFNSYLECFLEDSNSLRCQNKVGIDKTKLATCISSGKAKEYYAQDSALSQKYGVQGSPTLVINGVEASSGRNPQALLTAICSGFTSAPEKCSQTLSTANPSPGFGYAASTPSSDAAAAAQCG